MKIDICKYLWRCGIQSGWPLQSGNKKYGMGEREWKGKQMQAGAVSRRYAEDKPVSCDYCYFQIPGKKACELDKCFYLLLENRLEPEKDTADEAGCGGCPYGRIRSCIGFCMEKLLIEMRQKKCGKGGGADAG